MQQFAIICVEQLRARRYFYNQHAAGLQHPEAMRYCQIVAFDVFKNVKKNDAVESVGWKRALCQIHLHEGHAIKARCDCFQCSTSVVGPYNLLIRKVVLKITEKVAPRYADFQDCRPCSLGKRPPDGINGSATRGDVDKM